MIDDLARSLHSSHARRSGQALVELALVSALLALLLAAAVDAGLAYRTYQTLINATAEASSYLAQNPYAGSPLPTIATANANAVSAFRNEQDGTRTGTSGADATIQIYAADSSQVSLGAGGVYGVSSGFSGTSSAACLARRNTDSAGQPCYIVVRTTLIYRPFMLAPAFGSEMTIRAISIKPIVGYPNG